MTEQLAKILKEDSGVKSEYRHAPKRATPGDAIEISGVVLKWYGVHPEADPVPNEITTLARSFLLKTAILVFAAQMLLQGISQAIRASLALGRHKGSAAVTS